MILIYNLTGLLLGAAGAAVGILTALLTGRLSAGLAALAVVWLALGWRKVDAQTGQRRPYPALFFIPLVFLAMPLLVLAGPLFFVESVLASRRDARPADPRAALLDAAEAELRQSATAGDVKLSAAIREHLASLAVAEAKAEDFRVYTRVKPDAVLVILQVPNLRDFSDNAREQLLNFTEGMLLAEDETSGKDAYIGVKGKLAFGAIRVPPDVTKTGAAVPQSLLYPFFGAAPSATRPSASPAPTPATLPASSERS